MQFLDVIVMPISGAVIGYFTNWIAIKMLFRPRYEIRLFGKKLPFTPGLIPKERKRISEKIGETMSKNVLTQDVMENSLTSPEMKYKVDKLITNALDDIFKSEMTIEGIMCSVFGYKNEEMLEKTDKLIADTILNYMHNSALVKKLTEFLTVKVFDFIKSPDLIDGIADKSLESFLPEQWDEYARDYIKNQIPQLVEWLKLLPEKNQKLDESLREFVRTAAEENFGKIIGIFVNYDKVYDNMKNSLFQYIEKEENAELLLDKLFEFVSNFSKKSAAEIYDSIPHSVKDGIFNKLISFTESGSEGNSFIQTKLQMAILAEMDKRLPPLISKYTKYVLQIRLSDIFGKLSENQIMWIKENGKNAAKSMLVRGGGSVVRSLEVDKIIEEQLNKFTVEEAEKMIISVVNKELQAITALGGILGFIIGFMPLIIDKI